MANRTLKLLARTNKTNLYLVNECGSYVESKMNITVGQELSYEALCSLFKHGEFRYVHPRKNHLGTIINDWLASKR